MEEHFSKSINNPNRGNLHKASMFLTLTRRVTSNYHTLTSTNQTANHYIGQCLKWPAQRNVVFDSLYLSVSEVVDDFSIFVIMKYINATVRLNTTTEWQD